MVKYELNSLPPTITRTSGCDEESPSVSSDSDDDDDKCRNAAIVETPSPGMDVERKTLARKETRNVRRLRFIAFAVLLSTAITVTLSTYFLVLNKEESNFHSKFAVSAAKVMDSFHNSVRRKLGAIDSLAVSITSFASATGAVFPNVTLPDFEVRGASARIVAEAVVLEWNPLVTDETRGGWVQYSIENSKWKSEAAEAEISLRSAQDIKFNLPTNSSVQKSPMNITAETEEIFGADGTMPPDSGPYLPAWQVSPVPNVHVSNFNKLSHKIWRGTLLASLNTSQAVLGEASYLYDPGSDSSVAGTVMSDFLSLGQYRHVIEAYSGDPISVLAYPVFDNFDPDTRRLVGIVDTQLLWKLYFMNILPREANGVICVMQNTRGQSFTYKIDGPDVTFLGDGDLHDPRYDDMMVSEDVTAYLNEYAGPETESYTQVDLDDEYCRYTLQIFPSREMEQYYLTSTPIIFTIVIALVFLFASVVFVVYDLMVERRQNVVMNRAVASGAIVSSLFPQEIHDRLYKNGDSPAKGPTSVLSANTSDAKLKNFVKGHGGSTPSSEDGLVKASKAIADKFPSTTVFFADLVGFTQWSSTREPEQVFELLEGLYGFMDQIALRRGVFKVETIGDCYMAVTGLPRPQEDHALIMTRFARDCLAKIKSVTNELRLTLGEDTAHLQMRIGLHSGPVTAGVLRGQKARFQLFGDTVNTASRMESSGEPGRIHISQATADELIAKGKAHWLTVRPDKIVAKGKGEMQTFWVDCESLGTHTSSASGADDSTQNT